MPFNPTRKAHKTLSVEIAGIESNVLIESNNLGSSGKQEQSINKAVIRKIWMGRRGLGKSLQYLLVFNTFLV